MQEAEGDDAHSWKNTFENLNGATDNDSEQNINAFMFNSSNCNWILGIGASEKRTHSHSDTEQVVMPTPKQSPRNLYTDKGTRNISLSFSMLPQLVEILSRDLRSNASALINIHMRWMCGKVFLFRHAFLHFVRACAVSRNESARTNWCGTKCNGGYWNSKLALCFWLSLRRSQNGLVHNLKFAMLLPLRMRCITFDAENGIVKHIPEAFATLLFHSDFGSHQTNFCYDFFVWIYS